MSRRHATGTQRHAPESRAMEQKQRRMDVNGRQSPKQEQFFMSLWLTHKVRKAERILIGHIEVLEADRQSIAVGHTEPEPAAIGGLPGTDEIESFAAGHGTSSAERKAASSAKRCRWTRHGREWLARRQVRKRTQLMQAELHAPVGLRPISRGTRSTLALRSD